MLTAEDLEFLIAACTRADQQLTDHRLHHKFNTLVRDLINGNRALFDLIIYQCSIKATTDRDALNAIIVFYSIASKVASDTQSNELFLLLSRCRDRQSLDAIMSGAYKHHTFRYDVLQSHAVNIAEAYDAAIAAITLAILCNRHDWICD